MKVQKLSKVNKDPYALAHKYYQIMSVLNDLKLAEGEIQLVAFTSIRGNIADPEIRDEYCKTYKTTSATINNIVYRLKKKKIILKKDKEIFVNPALTQVNFDEPLALVVSLTLTSNEGKSPIKNTNTSKSGKEPIAVKTKAKGKSSKKKLPKEPTEGVNLLNVQKYG